MDDKIQIKDLNLGTPTDTSWLVFQDADTDVVYKAPKSDIEGHDAFVYIGYADDDIGTGFTLTFDSSKDYIAILSTDTEIPSPVVGDFAGLWKKYKGETGDQGDAATIQVGTVTTVDPGDPATVVNSGDEHSAVFNFEIPQGEKGACVVSVTFVGNDMVFTLEDSSTVTLIGAKSDLKGDTGDTGASIISAAFVGNDIVFTKDDATTVTLTNGKTILTGPKGDKGDTGDIGRGIVSIEKTNTVGLVDTYTITYSNSTTSTFDVINGAKGDKGDKGDIGPQGIQGIQGIQGNPGTNGIDGTDGISFTPKGAYNALTEYVANDVVSYLGSTWIALQTTTGNIPQEGSYWTLNASKGTDGEGSGDMLASVYDPTNVAGDAFDMDNMVEGTNNKLVSSTEKTAWNDKLDDITGESIADLSDVDSIAGITDGKVLKWSTDKFVIADDNDTTYSAIDFDIKDLTDSTNLRTTWNAKVDKSLFDANTILYATTDDTPVALTIPEQTIVGRKTGGNIEALAIDSDLSSVSANHDTVPSAKVTKDYADSKVEDSIVDGHTTIAPSGNAVFDALALKDTKTDLTKYSNLNAPEGFLINGKIVPSVASNNLTVAIKGLDGNDPSASNPVYCRIGDTIRTITSALSVTKNAGTNWCNAGSAELATKEVDYFVYIGYNATDGVVIGFSRIPYATLYSDFSTTTTNEKYCAISTITNAVSGDNYRNIGRFAATLSAGAGYTWTVPTFTSSNLIQRPIFETRWLNSNVTQTGFSSVPIYSFSYKFVGELGYLIYDIISPGTSNDTIYRITTPFAFISPIVPILGNNNGTAVGANVWMNSNLARIGNGFNNDGGWTSSGNKFAYFSICTKLR